MIHKSELPHKLPIISKVVQVLTSVPALYLYPLSPVIDGEPHQHILTASQSFSIHPSDTSDPFMNDLISFETLSANCKLVDENMPSTPSVIDTIRSCIIRLQELSGNESNEIGEPILLRHLRKRYPNCNCKALIRKLVKNGIIVVKTTNEGFTYIKLK